MGNRIAVIIPYYQNNKGLLLKAVESVKSQVINEGVDLIVVDDSSPHSAESELSNWDPGQDVRLEIINQPNSGPGIARNNGINNVASGIEYIAFLDSDDYWEENHLKFALMAFDAGADLYFSDFLYADGRRHMRNLEEQCKDLYEMFDPKHAFWKSTGYALQMLVLYGFVHTPTIVYRYKPFKSLRIPLDFYPWGDDQPFWLQLAISGAKAIFSTNVEAFGGCGVNIYSENVWGSVKQVHITSNEIRYRKYCLRSLTMADEAVNYSRRNLVFARSAMMCQLLHHVRRGAVFLFIKQILSDPLTLKCLPAIIASIVMKKKFRNSIYDRGL